MIVRKFIFICLFTVLAGFAASAKTVKWAVKPAYAEITRLNSGIYLVQNGGKWGAVLANGRELLPAAYDYILPLCNGYSMLLNEVGSGSSMAYELEGLLSADGQVTLFDATYYLPPKHQFYYVSEGKIAVANEYRKCAYINVDGERLTGYDFDDALPFRSGHAPVRKGQYMYFIRDSYSPASKQPYLMIDPDFHYGEVSKAGCFAGDNAPIQFNDDYALINRSGRVVRRLNRSEFNRIYQANCTGTDDPTELSELPVCTPFTSKEKTGLKAADGSLVLPAQLDGVLKQFADGAIIAAQGGKLGVMQLSDDHIAVSHSVEGENIPVLEVDRHGKLPSVIINCQLPSDRRGIQLLVDEGNGTLTDRTRAIGPDGTYAFVPAAGPKDEECSIRYVLKRDGLLLADHYQKYDIEYPVVLSISRPGPARAEANSNHYATVSATVHNESARAVRVTVRWSTGAENTVELAPNSSRSVSYTRRVDSLHTANIGVTMYVDGEQTGSTASSNITFVPYF